MIYVGCGAIHVVTYRIIKMAEVFACLVYVLDGSTVSIDVNVSKIMYK